MGDARGTRGSPAGRRGLRQPLLALLLLVALSAGAHAQPAADPARVVAQVEASYEALDYAQAEALARQALARPEVFSRDHLVRLHTTLGLLLYAQNDPLAAAEQFRAALSLDPRLTLDPVLVSPVTVAFFESTKEAFLREQAGTPRPEPAVRYVVVRDRRPGAALRSLALPGWGQRAKRQAAWGWALTAAWAATLGGGAYAHAERLQARRAYLDAPTPEEAEALYGPYNRWHKTRGALLAGTGVVYAVAVLDALATGAPEAPPVPARLSVEPGGMGLRLRVRL